MKKHGPYHFKAFLPWPLKEIYAYARYNNIKLVLIESMKREDETTNMLNIGYGEGALEWLLQRETIEGYFV